MSNRSLLEFNHDCYPDSGEEQAWLDGLLAYLRSGQQKDLPRGVKFCYMRHHSEPCPLDKPVSPPVKSAYGFCPYCGAAGKTRERRLNGNDRCEQGHEYPSRLATPLSIARMVDDR